MRSAIPKWTRWKLSEKINTGSSRVDTQNGKEADVKSAFNPSSIEEKLLQTMQNIQNVAKDKKTITSNNRVRSTSKVPIKSNNKTNSAIVREASDEQKDGYFEYCKKNNEQRKWNLYSKNEYKTESSFDYSTLRNRKLSYNLALLFSKLAEERSGERVIGEDNWDIKSIMFRSVTKKLINDCKYSKEKQRLVLMLDSSPSCEKMARMYSQIATESAKFDDVEIYDAPNGYAHSIYDPLIKEFRKLTKDEAVATWYWGCFTNRTIIYFGDNDAVRSLRESYKYNDIHWFYQAYRHSSQEESMREIEFLRTEWDGKLTVHMCNNVDELIQSAKDMR